MGILSAQQQQPTLFVGIDFGTSASGYSYVVLNSTEPWLQNSYPEQASPYPKCPTALLYDGGGQPLAWGWQARNMYMGMTEQQKRAHHYVKGFKLALAGRSIQDLPTDCTAEKAIADYLRLLHGHCLDVLVSQFSSSFSPSLVRYAITVPANWDEEAKQIMRHAAAEAGIIPHPASNQLLLLHEPEAAALTVSVTDQHVDLHPGQLVIVVDAGGGTVDITVHEVSERGRGTLLSEATYRAGITRGATFVDAAFEAWLVYRLGEVYTEWKGNPKNATGYLKFLDKEWEHEKRQFSGDDLDRGFPLSLPKSLHKMLSDDVVQQLEDESGEDNVLLIRGSDMAGFFDMVLDDILSEVAEVLDRCPQQPSAMMLVGGLGSSRYFAQRIKEAFPDMRPVITPPYAYSAVVQGAALYAANPGMVQARRSAASYGIEVAGRFTADCPQGREHCFLHRDEGVLYCCRLFKQFVQLNALIKTDDEVVHTFYPLYRYQRSVTFDIYGSDQPHPRFTIEPGMIKVASVCININDPSKVMDPAHYRLRAIMKFGTTEIQVVVIDEQTGHEAKVDFVFSHAKTVA